MDKENGYPENSFIINGFILDYPEDKSRFRMMPTSRLDTDKPMNIVEI